LFERLSEGEAEAAASAGELPGGGVPAMREGLAESGVKKAGEGSSEARGSSEKGTHPSTEAAASGYELGRIKRCKTSAREKRASSSPH
jgi:hypothetical protein